ncbi:MAG: hypothetical protein D6724_03920 [Armatimonadetes bacterium]|nr:MAG: hypothetical protein D6724_03920 [Armatimonadota bacterium]
MLTPATPKSKASLHSTAISVIGPSTLPPSVAWALSVGLFEYLKLALTLLVCAAMLFLWPRSAFARQATIAANVLMGVLLAYHVSPWARAMHLFE